MFWSKKNLVEKNFGQKLFVQKTACQKVLVKWVLFKKKFCSKKFRVKDFWALKSFGKKIGWTKLLVKQKCLVNKVVGQIFFGGGQVRVNLGLGS